PDVVLRRFDALDAELPDEPVTRTYRGELLLWLGRYAEAIVSFDRALALSELTTWAWIGKGAAQWLSGDAAAAHATWDRGVEAVDFEGPTLFVYRGEALRAAGAIDEARLELDLALRNSRRRVSSWILRALVAADRGDRLPAQRVAAAVREQIPGLWLDARRATGTDDPPMVLEACLRLMRGNRSSSTVTWQLGDGPLSSGTFQPPWAPEELFPSVRDAPPRNAERHRGRVARVQATGAGPAARTSSGM
ncbi:MAG TPA: tetratricopeptide repeat protein, partial [Myxococcota bacterium]|nr:tetratricopeptide repeat protein [Myxococcota bacterium]